jgi:hypothetical protein
LTATILIGKSAAPKGWGDMPTSLRRRAEKLLSDTERQCLLESHSQLASLLHANSDQANFSLSRRGGYFAVAVHASEKIGVDLEQVIAADDINAVASCYFPASLYATHRRLPVAQQRRHFTACWSALEAVAKLRSQPLEEAGASLDSAVLYQSWISCDIILSVALNQETPLQLTGIAECQSPFTRVTSPLTEYL